MTPQQAQSYLAGRNGNGAAVMLLANGEKWEESKHPRSKDGSFKGVKDNLREAEGLRLKTYKDTKGKMTIGYGHLQKHQRYQKISKELAEKLFDEDVAKAEGSAKEHPAWSKMSESQRAALVEMHFALGAGGANKFKKMNDALAKGDSKEAAAQVLDSQVAREQPNRYERLSKMMGNGAPMGHEFYGNQYAHISGMGHLADREFDEHKVEGWDIPWNTKEEMHSSIQKLHDNFASGNTVTKYHDEVGLTKAQISFLRRAGLVDAQLNSPPFQVTPLFEVKWKKSKGVANESPRQIMRDWLKDLPEKIRANAVLTLIANGGSGSGWFADNENNPHVAENNGAKFSDSDTGAYHYGDGGTAHDTKADRMDSGRSTGHLGTGVYFFGKKDAPGSNAREGRPLMHVDLTDLNMAKPHSSSDAYELHDSLRKFNRAIWDGKEIRFDEPRFETSQAAFALRNSLKLGYSTHSEEQIHSAMKAVADDFKAKKTDGIRTPSTYLMQKLGYHGIDMRGTKADNGDIGSVVFFNPRKKAANELFANGGRGSGNFGHSGRPGFVGGSSTEDMVSEPLKDAEITPQKLEDLKELADHHAKVAADVAKGLAKAKGSFGWRHPADITLAVRNADVKMRATPSDNGYKKATDLPVPPPPFRVSYGASDAEEVERQKEIGDYSKKLSEHYNGIAERAKQDYEASVSRAKELGISTATNRATFSNLKEQMHGEVPWTPTSERGWHDYYADRIQKVGLTYEPAIRDGKFYVKGDIGGVKVEGFPVDPPKVLDWRQKGTFASAGHVDTKNINLLSSDKDGKAQVISIDPKNGGITYHKVSTKTYDGQSNGRPYLEIVKRENIRDLISKRGKLSEEHIGSSSHAEKEWGVKSPTTYDSHVHEAHKEVDEAAKAGNVDHVSAAAKVADEMRVGKHGISVPEAIKAAAKIEAHVLRSRITREDLDRAYDFSAAARGSSVTAAALAGSAVRSHEGETFIEAIKKTSPKVNEERTRKIAEINNKIADLRQEERESMRLKIPGKENAAIDHSSQIKQLRDEQARVSAERDSSQNTHDAIKRAALVKMFPHPGHGQAKIVGKITNDNHGTPVTHQDTLDKVERARYLLASSLHPEVANKILNTDVGVVPRRRANYTGKINIENSEPVGTIIHEFGHHIEKHAHAGEPLMNFVTDRSAGLPVRKLSELTGNDAYDSFEKAHPGKFISPYVGKKYHKDRVTEVLSMGLQEALTNPEHLWKHDREHFLLTLSVMHGVGLNKPKP